HGRPDGRCSGDHPGPNRPVGRPRQRAHPDQGCGAGSARRGRLDPYDVEGEGRLGVTALTVDVVDHTGAKTGTVDLPEEIFGVQVNIPLIHQVVTAQLAAKRQGTHATKTRGEVSGGGKKPYRQKGTGRARQGSTRAPQFTGGGTVHGPKPRDYSQRTPKKMIAAALRGALSDRARN